MADVTLTHSQLADLSAEILCRGSAMRFTAHGASMRPFIRDGDALVVKPVDVSRLRIGDVVLYRTSGDGLMAHRIVGQEGVGDRASFIIRGDASTGAGDRVRPEQILGRVTRLRRGGAVRRVDGGTQRALGLLWGRLLPSIRWCLGWMRAVRRGLLS